MVRQAVFRLDGSITDVPTRETERPQLERQGDLLQYGVDQENLKRIEEGKADDTGEESQNQAAKG